MYFIRITKYMGRKDPASHRDGRVRARVRRRWSRVVLGAAMTVALAGCAGLHPQPNGPGDCYGPASFCNIYFGGG
jgi:hypothetical protein